MLPDEAESLRAGQEAILAEMRRWGYRFVVTPTLESVDALALGLGPEQQRRLFKFADADGSLIALVGEKTIPVARLAAGQLRSAPLPLRLCYAASVVSNDGGRFANRRETHQVGAELVGAAGPAADAEVIALAVRCLDAAGLKRYQVDVGHSEFFHGLLAGLKLPAEIESGVRAALAARDFVALERLLETTPLRSAERELLLRFPALRGGREILDAAGRLVANRRSERALADLARVEELLREHGLGGQVNLDLGAIRDFDYYTGVIFEGYGADLGRPLAVGGRYDRLLERFGRPAPATGFVVHLDLVAEAIARAGGPPDLPRLDAAVAWSAAGLPVALKLGSSLRLFGMRAVVDTESRSLAAARRWRGQVGAQSLVHCGGAGPVTWAAGSRTRRLPPEQVVAQIVGALR
ncbi:MAG: ATP phosphoribosyltransferase regulatory subunit [Chloroflexi bacterium]|nr:MAG: ATP phosphoribosyltransferase regulatory subunit [Chloroflexota bacterium]TME18616.1 MAG: ATP phosphoribosyltransferase regulatory subunit [Chloroflexota bacterium]